MSLFIPAFQKTYVTLHKIKMEKKQTKKKISLSYSSATDCVQAFYFRFSSSYFYAEDCNYH